MEMQHSAELMFDRAWVNIHFFAHYLSNRIQIAAVFSQSASQCVHTYLDRIIALAQQCTKWSIAVVVQYWAFLEQVVVWTDLLSECSSNSSVYFRRIFRQQLMIDDGMYIFHSTLSCANFVH